MPLTAQFTVAAPCDGGNHFNATLTLSNGQSVVIPVDRTWVRELLTDEERAQFATLLIRIYARQMTGQTAFAIKTAVEAKVLDLTVVG